MLIGRPSGALRPEINLPQKDGIAAPITKAHNSRDMRLAVTSVSLSPRLLDDSYRFLPSKVSSGLEFRSSSRERKEGRKEGKNSTTTRCFVVTDDWTIKLRGEISSDCPERNLVTAAGP